MSELKGVGENFYFIYFLYKIRVYVVVFLDIFYRNNFGLYICELSYCSWDS